MPQPGLARNNVTNLAQTSQSRCCKIGPIGQVSGNFTHVLQVFDPLLNGQLGGCGRANLLVGRQNNGEHFTEPSLCPQTTKPPSYRTSSFPHGRDLDARSSQTKAPLLTQCGLEGMAGVLCVWADLPPDATDWYEDEYIRDMCSQNAIHTLHCTVTENGLDNDPIGKLDSPWEMMTVYESDDIQKMTAQTYDKRNHPAHHLLTGGPQEARFDCVTYRELKRWQADDWDGGKIAVLPE